MDKLQTEKMTKTYGLPTPTSSQCETHASSNESAWDSVISPQRKGILARTINRIFQSGGGHGKSPINLSRPTFLSKVTPFASSQDLIACFRKVFIPVQTKPQQPSDATLSVSGQFPHAMEYTVQSSAKGFTQKKWDLLRALPSLENLLEHKQGFALVRSAGSKSQIAPLRKYLETHEGYELSSNSKIVGLRATNQRHPDKPAWLMEIYDRGLGQIIEVPITEIEMNDTDSDTDLPSKLTRIKASMDQHLQAIHPAFQDSPVQPAILCPSNPRLAILATTQEELISRQQRGEIRMPRGDSPAVWLDYADEVLGQLTGTTQGFINEESTDFANFYHFHLSRQNQENAQLGRSIGASSVTEESSPLKADQIRGYKRHPIWVESSTEQSANAATATSTASQPAPAVPGYVRPLQLDDITPAFRPSKSDDTTAYKYVGEQMQCGLQALNSYFQGPVLDVNQTAVLYADRAEQVCTDAFNARPEEMRGLLHPKLLQAFRAGQSCTISRADFFPTDINNFPNVNGVEVPDGIEDEWKKLFNMTHPHLNYMDNRDFYNATTQLVVSPSQWISCFKGMEMETLLSTINTLLASRTVGSGWDHLPDRVEHHQIATHLPSANEERSVLAERIIQSQAFYKALGQDFPMLLLRGQGGAGGSNHYFAVTQNQQGRWLNLNSEGAKSNGTQPCSVFSEENALAEALKEHSVTHIVCPKLI